MPQNSILVVGSANTDLVVKATDFPQPGETILGQGFIMNSGGKGANQAVASARLGGRVIFTAKIGKDVFGEYTVDALKKEGIDINYLLVTNEYPSGIALIVVNQKGENTIVVSSGANMQLFPEDIPDKWIIQSHIILVQLEIPLMTVLELTQKAKRYGKTVVLNPAPAMVLPDELLDGLFLISPNETETAIITGIYPGDLGSMQNAGLYLLKKGVRNIAITLGSKSVFLMNADGSQIIPATMVETVDTTAAGDVFNGAIVTALSEGVRLSDACRFACKAASISVTRMGAQSSAPYRNEIYN